MCWSRATLMIVVLSVVSACSTFSDIEQGLSGFVGRPADHVFAALGFPEGEQRIAGQTVYVWGNAFSMTLPQTNTATTTGYVGTTPYSGTTSYTSSTTYNYNCTIRVMVDERNIVRRWDYQGNIGGCSQFASMLNRAQRQGRK